MERVFCGNRPPANHQKTQPRKFCTLRAPQEIRLDWARMGGTSDGTVDLDYMKARYHSPNHGAFLTTDPGGVDPAVPVTWNRYTYVNASPLDLTDPSGEDPYWDLSSSDQRLVQQQMPYIKAALDALGFDASAASATLMPDEPERRWDIWNWSEWWAQFDYDVEYQAGAADAWRHTAGGDFFGVDRTVVGLHSSYVEGTHESHQLVRIQMFMSAVSYQNNHTLNRAEMADLVVKSRHYLGLSLKFLKKWIDEQVRASMIGSAEGPLTPALKSLRKRVKDLLAFDDFNKSLLYGERGGNWMRVLKAGN